MKTLIFLFAILCHNFILQAQDVLIFKNGPFSGLISSTGKVILEPVYTYIGSFSEDELARISNKAGKSG
ncbi:MAG: WG repeat-containing protein [Ginsengibacter sp.]